MTEKQEKYRKQLLGKKFKGEKCKKYARREKYEPFKKTIGTPAYGFPGKPWQTKMWYLYNCFFWIKYLTKDGIEAVTDKKRMKEVINALRIHCDEMEALLNKEQ